LVGTVEPDDQCGKHLARDVVEFIDGQKDTARVVASDLSYFDEKTRKILLEVARVSSGYRVDVKAELRSIRYLQTEGLHYPESPARAISDPPFRIHVQQYEAERTSESPWELTVFGDLDMCVEETVLVGKAFKLVQKDRFTDSA
jgi:hypothetical protein